MAYCTGAMVLCFPVFAQESRGAIQGRVIDPTEAPVAGASVLAGNLDTGTTVRLVGNITGHYEANLLLPGTYRVVAESKGYKKLIRSGMVMDNRSVISGFRNG